MISTFTVPLFIVIDENFRFASILQLAPTPTLHIGPFKFTLVASFAFEGFRYIVALGDMSLSVLLLPVDTSAREAGPLSNLDVLNFLWQYYEHFNFRKFGIIAFPVRDRARFLYVQHHARSDGCTLTPACRYVVCVRQPPSPKASAAYVMFTFVFNLERFRVLQVTTYHHFVYAFS